MQTGEGPFKMKHSVNKDSSSSSSSSSHHSRYGAADGGGGVLVRWPGARGSIHRPGVSEVTERASAVRGTWYGRIQRFARRRRHICSAPAWRGNGTSARKIFASGGCARERGQRRELHDRSVFPINYAARTTVVAHWRSRGTVPW